MRTLRQVSRPRMNAGPQHKEEEKQLVSLSLRKKKKVLLLVPLLLCALNLHVVEKIQRDRIVVA